MASPKTIYLDYQATTPLDPGVFSHMAPYLQDRVGNPHSSHHALGWQAAEAVREAAEAVGALIGADADEIVFTSGATEANNMALLGLLRLARESGRNRVLLSAIEHKCVLAAGRVLAERHGLKVELVPVDGEGRVRLDALAESLAEDVLVLSVMWVNNEIGTIQDLQSLSELAASHGAILHCDAAQAPCALDMAKAAGQVDLLSLSAHKMYGPMGVGALYVRSDLHDSLEPLIVGGGQQNGLRSGTVPVPLCVGMGAAAATFAGEAARTEREAVAKLRDQLLDGLMSLSAEAKLNGPVGHGRHPGNINLSFGGINAEDLLSALQPRIAASTGAACTTGTPEPSHVLKAIGLGAEEAESSVRFSVGRGLKTEGSVGAVEAVGAAIQSLMAG